ncbi:uncharacterized protein METZ01_LOCUS70275 [marine metagenome]|jgi:hypothetical protein|uniref:Uncharacterized protein n=1 Tax=marine metagenome TaxID=408172 RepID=A0A381TPL7_9ZZZZ|tara:strand:- start:55 stop:348 length:294 start_codon:yes stop_codon:yes gene_type:complete
MADKKITDLTAATVASKDDLVMVVDDPAGASPSNKKITIQNFFKVPSSNTGNVTAYTNTTAGQVAWVTDGNAGTATLAVFDGTNWKVVSQGSTISHN